jgi:23S rRNA pseudouridine2605 synthase
MRLNKYVAQATGMSRRRADELIATGRVQVDGSIPTMGQDITAQTVTFDNEIITLPAQHTTIMLHKPTGYICSRDGQGNPTIYELIPETLHHLKPVGRLDKNSSGLLLMTDDGDLAQQLTHPSNRKIKQYTVHINKPLAPLHRQMISDYGVQLEDGPSKLQLERIDEKSDKDWIVTMHEGRNRQIRRTFESLGYHVARLHRTHFGNYVLDDLQPGKTKLT